MNRLESVVIVRCPKGYVAHLRFADPGDNANLSSYSHYLIYHLVEAYVDKTVGAYV